MAAPRMTVTMQRLPCSNKLKQAFLLFVVLSILTGIIYPLADHRHCASGLSLAGQRQPDLSGRQAGRLGADRPAVHRSQILLEPAVGHVADALQRRIVGRIEPGTDQSRSGRRPFEQRIAALRAADPGNDAPFPSTSSPRRPAGSTRTSAPPPPNTKSPGWRRPAAWTRKPCGNWSPTTPKAAPSACWANPGSMW